MLMFSFIFVIVCGLFEWRRIGGDLLLLVYICMTVGDPNIKEGGSVSH